MAGLRSLTRNQDNKIGRVSVGGHDNPARSGGRSQRPGVFSPPSLGLNAGPPLPSCPQLPEGSHTRGGPLDGHGQLHAPLAWRKDKLRTSESCRGQLPLHMPLLVPPGAWHPPGHGAWHGRTRAGPGRREEGEERGSGSGRGLRREMSSRRPGLGWLGARLGEFLEPGAPTPDSRGPQGLGAGRPRLGKPAHTRTLGPTGGPPSPPHLNPQGLPISWGAWCSPSSCSLCSQGAPLPLGLLSRFLSHVRPSQLRVLLRLSFKASFPFQLSGSTFLTPVLLLTGTPLPS